MGIKPVVLAIIALAIFKLGKKALKNVQLAILGTIVLVISFFGVNEVYLLLGAGLVGALLFYGVGKFKQKDLKSFAPLLLLQGGTGVASITAISSAKVFWIFLKVGAVLYGSGYVLFAYLDAELVDKGFLTQSQLLDAIAIGQFTPGPVLSTATFIGYQLSGFSGAMMASVGIFLPSFLFVLILNPLVPKMRKSVFLSHFLNAVNIAAVAVMAGVLFEMGQQTLIDWKSISLAILSFAVVFKYQKLSPIYIIAGGAILGYVLHLL